MSRPHQIPPYRANKAASPRIASQGGCWRTKDNSLQRPSPDLQSSLELHQLRGPAEKCLKIPRHHVERPGGSSAPSRGSDPSASGHPKPAAACTPILMPASPSLPRAPSGPMSFACRLPSSSLRQQRAPGRCPGSPPLKEPGAARGWGRARHGGERPRGLREGSGMAAARPRQGEPETAGLPSLRGCEAGGGWGQPALVAGVPCL